MGTGFLETSFGFLIPGPELLKITLFFKRIIKLNVETWCSVCVVLSLKICDILKKLTSSVHANLGEYMH